MSKSQQNRTDRVKARQLEQSRNLFSRMSAAALASRAQAQRMLRTAGDLSITEWRVLWDLASAGPLTVTEMAAIQKTDHAIVSRSIPQMVKQGYVTTETSMEDRRQSLIALTAAGRQVFEAASQVMAARREALAQSFSEADLNTFLALIDRFEQFTETAFHEPSGSENAS